MILFLETVNQILTAGVAITAFSLLLYALTFNLKNRVAMAFAMVMVCVVIVFTAEAIGSVAATVAQVGFWLRLQWVGIILLPAIYLHFSDILLATTGKPSRWRRRLAVRVVYAAAILFLISLPTGWFVGSVQMDTPPAPHLEPTLLTGIFTLFYLAIMGLTAINLVRAYRRTTTPTSRRRMAYLITGALAPALGSFQYLLFGSRLVVNHLAVFWLLAILSNFLVAGLLILMAYAVAFFGVSWPDRVVRRRLFKWLMRGPFTGSLTLAISTITGRALNVMGSTNTSLVPVVMVATIILSEYLITVFSPLGEKVLFYGMDQTDVSTLRRLEDRLLTQNDLRQFMEMVLGAICDQLQVPGAYIAGLSEGGVDLMIRVGRARFEEVGVSDQLQRLASTRNDALPDWFQWGDDILVPLMNGNDEENEEEGQETLLGLLGITGMGDRDMEEEQARALRFFANRAKLALIERSIQQKVFRSLQTLSPEMERIQRIRAAGGYTGSDLNPNNEEEDAVSEKMNHWVKDALTHYWGGPKLTDNPLMAFRIVQHELDQHDGNQANALRAILRKAIDQVRPDGERRFTGEWILYNILEMKFMEGRKVREVAARLAVSEADLYRKQRVAIESVANSIMEMEIEIQSQISNDPKTVD